jgi:hypothetical protein
MLNNTVYYLLINMVIDWLKFHVKVHQICHFDQYLVHIMHLILEH